MQKTLIIVGFAIVALGLLWPWLGKIPLGRLPGDIIISRPNLKIYFPLTSMMLVSIIITIVLWLFKK